MTVIAREVWITPVYFCLCPLYIKTSLISVHNWPSIRKSAYRFFAYAFAIIVFFVRVDGTGKVVGRISWSFRRPINALSFVYGYAFLAFPTFDGPRDVRRVSGSRFMGREDRMRPVWTGWFTEMLIHVEVFRDSLSYVIFGNASMEYEYESYLEAEHVLHFVSDNEFALVEYRLSIKRKNFSS